MVQQPFGGMFFWPYMVFAYGGVMRLASVDLKLKYPYGGETYAKTGVSGVSRSRLVSGFTCVEGG